ncbi:hypothetical protein M8J75_012369 [Diaphorina citri]|nr:hypothetical protein M8J75_012369 [Diaphorina citri]
MVCVRSKCHVPEITHGVQDPNTLHVGRVQDIEENIDAIFESGVKTGVKNIVKRSEINSACVGDIQGINKNNGDAKTTRVKTNVKRHANSVSEPEIQANVSELKQNVTKAPDIQGGTLSNAPKNGTESKNVLSDMDLNRGQIVARNTAAVNTINELDMKATSNGTQIKDELEHSNISKSVPDDTQYSNISKSILDEIQYSNISKSLADGIPYVNISNRVEGRGNVSHRPQIKHRLDNDPDGVVKKFTIQDTFDELKNIHDQEDSEIAKLIKHVMKHYLSNCMIIFLYDELFYASVTLRSVITEILEYSPLPVMHGMINTSGLTYHTPASLLDPPERKCRNFIILTKNLENSAELMGRQRDSKIVFVAYMSSYQIKSFLADTLSHNIVNLLIIADPNLQHDEFNRKSEFYSIDMYTHRLYTDSLGTSIPWVLTSWRNGNFTRPWVNLFPDKLNTGFCGHRFIVSVAQQPPFIFRRQAFVHDTSGKIVQSETNEWDGLELKILKQMSYYLNMTIDIHETSSSNPGDGGSGRVIFDIMQDRATIGIAGIAMTEDRLHNVSFSASHTQDCAVFVTVTSFALSKYRAIFGPFKWEVWVCLVLVYLLAIIPLSFSDKLTLRHLWEKPSEIENMFWYMFGTFTNLFTFRNTNSWTSSKKASTRAFVGTYWVFSIIITAAYTGSIIAFITLPAIPETIDTLHQLKSERCRVVTLDSGGWQKFNDTEEDTVESEVFEKWELVPLYSILFQTVADGRNSGGWQKFNDTEEDTVENEVFEKWELVPKVEDGLRNVTKGHLLWNYAFLGSRAQMEHIIKNNFESSPKKERSKKKFHIGKQCYEPMYLGFVYPKSSLLNTQLDQFILKAQQSGLMMKWMRDVQWDNWRNDKGGRLQAGAGHLTVAVPEDRMLALDDTLGMFLLLGFGFTLAILAFINECLTHYNKRIFCCKEPSQPAPPKITLTPADNTPVTSVENLDTSVSVYDMHSPSHRELIAMSISPHRRYSMTQLDDKLLVDWAKRRNSH